MRPLKKGQVSFEKLLPLKTCHDIRRWRTCSHCAKLGDKDAMLNSGDGFWHGRCFARQFGMERLLDMPREQVNRLSLGDLGAQLMRELIEAKR